jgi:cytochrome oxidase Cu insertion factor (SCO1/SenC/PrrC family)
VFINDFIIHNTGYANIDLFFNQQNRDDKNQIENYLDRAFGGIHMAEINETIEYIKNKLKTCKKFIISKNNEICDNFKIIYICKSPGKVNYATYFL